MGNSPNNNNRPGGSPPWSQGFRPGGQMSFPGQANGGSFPGQGATGGVFPGTQRPQMSAMSDQGTAPMTFPGQGSFPGPMPFPGGGRPDWAGMGRPAWAGQREPDAVNMGRRPEWTGGGRPPFAGGDDMVRRSEPMPQLQMPRPMANPPGIARAIDQIQGRDMPDQSRALGILQSLMRDRFGG